MDQDKNRSAHWLPVAVAATEDLGNVGITPGLTTLCFHMTPLHQLLSNTSHWSIALPQPLPTAPNLPHSFHFFSFSQVLRDLPVRNSAGESCAIPKHCLPHRPEQRRNEPETGITLPDQVTGTRTSETKDMRSISSHYTRRTGNEPVFQVSVAAIAGILNFCVSFHCLQQKRSFMGDCMFASQSSENAVAFLQRCFLI